MGPLFKDICAAFSVTLFLFAAAVFLGALT